MPQPRLQAACPSQPSTTGGLRGPTINHGWHVHPNCQLRPSAGSVHIPAIPPLVSRLVPPPVRHFVGLRFLYRAPDSHPLFPSHAASGPFFLTAAAAGVPCGVVSA